MGDSSSASFIHLLQSCVRPGSALWSKGRRSQKCSCFLAKVHTSSPRMDLHVLSATMMSSRKTKESFEVLTAESLQLRSNCQKIMRSSTTQIQLKKLILILKTLMNVKDYKIYSKPAGSDW